MLSPLIYLDDSYTGTVQYTVVAIESPLEGGGGEGAVYPYYRAVDNKI
jgi:hypothetical protein